MTADRSSSLAKQKSSIEVRDNKGNSLSREEAIIRRENGEPIVIIIDGDQDVLLNEIPVDSYEETSRETFNRGGYTVEVTDWKAHIAGQNKPENR